MVLNYRLLYDPFVVCRFFQESQLQVENHGCAKKPMDIIFYCI
jgi:hypothetical protein